MRPPVERVRLSQSAKEQLVKLKRITKIDQWNILCRWAFCRSLSEPTPPSPIPLKTDSNVEMNWKTFGGEIADILVIALKTRCYNDGLKLDPETLETQFHLHLHRGIAYLAGDPSIKSLESLVTLIMQPSVNLKVANRQKGLY